MFPVKNAMLTLGMGTIYLCQEAIEKQKGNDLSMLKEVQNGLSYEGEVSQVL